MKGSTTEMGERKTHRIIILIFDDFFTRGCESSLNSCFFSRNLINSPEKLPRPTYKFSEIREH